MQKVSGSLIGLLLAVSYLPAQATSWYPSGKTTQSNQIKVTPLTCPTIGKDHSQMISQLHSLQDKIRGDANCGKLVENLEKISLVSGDRRKDFLETVEKVRNGEVVDDRTLQTDVIQYAEDVTVLVGSLASLLADSGQCFNEQDRSQSLFTLSAFVNEASTLLSTVAGPWGPAVAIGGKVVAGFLTGVTQLINSMPGYDFHDAKDWQGYVETLCTFHEQQDEITALIHPEEAIRNLGQLNNTINQSLDRVISTSQFGEEVRRQFMAQNEEGLKRAAEQMNKDTGAFGGIKAVQLLTARRWIQDRIDTIEDQANDPLAPGKYLVQKQRDQIEEFLIANQAPKFVRHQVSESQKSLRTLETFIMYEGAALYDQIERAKKANAFSFLRPRQSNQEILTYILDTNEMEFYGKNTKEDQLYSSIVYFKRELGKLWDATTISYGVKSSFCAFFQGAGYYNSSLRTSCDSRGAEQMEKVLAQYEHSKLSDKTPAYLYRMKDVGGANWTEALHTWANQL